MTHTVPIVDTKQNIRHVLTLIVLKKNVRTAVMTPNVFLFLNMARFGEMIWLATWNLAPIVIDSCVKCVMTLLSTVQFAAVPIVWIVIKTEFRPRKIWHIAMVAIGGVVLNASPRSVPNVALYCARTVPKKGWWHHMTLSPIVTIAHNSNPVQYALAPISQVMELTTAELIQCVWIAWALEWRWFPRSHLIMEWTLDFPLASGV